MLFNSWIFLCFFTLVLAVYWRLPHKWQNRFLLLASYVFYCAWDWRFLGLILFSTAVDFFAARAMVNRGDSRRRALLIASLVSNLGLLAFFKYFNFFVESASAFLGRLGLESHPDILRIILPVGISFYTFQSLSYTVDCYRNKSKRRLRLSASASMSPFFHSLSLGRLNAPIVCLLGFRHRVFWLATRCMKASGSFCWASSRRLSSRTILQQSCSPFTDKAMLRIASASLLALMRSRFKSMAISAATQTLHADARSYLALNSCRISHFRIWLDHHRNFGHVGIFRFLLGSLLSQR